MDRERYEAGKAVRADVLGPLPVANEWSRPFQDLALEYCWGAIWARRGLTGGRAVC
jgi:4-carboxymuconolactone decarboxylase